MKKREETSVLTFHSKRRMFAVVEGSLLLAPRSTPMSHIEWLSAVFGPKACNHAMATFTRGYCLSLAGKHTQVFYVKDFDSTPRVEEDARKWCLELCMLTGTQATKTEVHLGCVKSDNGVVWPPQKVLGTVEQVCYALV